MNLNFDTSASDDKKKSKKDKKEKKEEKKSKKDKGHASAEATPTRESNSSKKTAGITASLNLLDLDFGGPPAAATLPSQPLVALETGEKKDKKKDKKGDKKEKSGLWLPFHSGRSVDILYSLGDSGVKRVSFRLINRGPVGLTISADVTFKSLHPFQSLSGNTLRLSHHLVTGAEADSHMDIECPDVVTGNVNLPASVRIMLESASGVETKNEQVSLKIPICASFTPNELNEEAFSANISKSSSRWASSNARVVSSGMKPKHAFRAISSFLRAHMVEAESSKAASYAAKTPSGAKVFVLVKAAKEGGKDYCYDNIRFCSKSFNCHTQSQHIGSIAVEVKSLGSTKSESQTICDAISSALGQLSL